MPHDYRGFRRGKWCGRSLRPDAPRWPNADHVSPTFSYLLSRGAYVAIGTAQWRVFREPTSASYSPRHLPLAQVPGPWPLACLVSVVPRHHRRIISGFVSCLLYLTSSGQQRVHSIGAQHVGSSKVSGCDQRGHITVYPPLRSRSSLARPVLLILLHWLWKCDRGGAGMRPGSNHTFLTLLHFTSPTGEAGNGPAGIFRSSPQKNCRLPHSQEQVNTGTPQTSCRTLRPFWHVHAPVCQPRWNLVAR